MTKMVNEYKLECYREIMPLGTKGNLWIVEDSVTGRRFVMRKLSKDLQQIYERLASIHHSNIVEIVDIFLHNGFLYVIEEYLEGELLSDAISEKRFSHHQVFLIGRQLFNVLFVLHGQSIVHRDIKPENIIIDGYGNVKLIDFDIARIFAEDKNGDTTIKGSRDYAPPEQFGFAQTDQRADIYSLGVTLNELAVGKLPEEKICGGKLGDVIRRCIEFDPKRRYQNAAQALKHIDRLEKRTIIFVLSATVLSAVVILLSLLIYLKVSTSSDILLDESGQTSKEQSAEPETDACTFDFTEYQDRIIYVQEPDQYPALLMAENQEYEFSANLQRGLTVDVSAKKENAQLFFVCELADGSTVDFEFNDVFSEVYKQQGYSKNTDFEKTSPEYEILLNDINEDGITDLLVTLAWRCRIDTPDPENRFYFTEYSILWVVYITEDKEFACSEPLYFNGCEPTLQTDALVYDYENTVWYTFYDGIWN